MEITASEAAEQKQVKIVFCYAHEDELLLNQLKSHLQPLQRQGLITLWYDREIRAGSEWKQEIKKQLDTAQIILLLVSPDFMASDYCYSIEMQHALERHQIGEATVIPIILRPVYWHGEPLGRLQALPTDGKPVTDPDWHDPDRAFYNITNGIYQVIEKLTAASLISFKPEAFSLRRTLWHGNRVEVVAFSSDGLTLASGSNGIIKLWNLASGKEVQIFTVRRHSLRDFLNASSTVNYLAFSPDRQTLVSGEWEQTVTLWSLTSGKEIQTFTKHIVHHSSVNDYAMAFSPNGLMLARYSFFSGIKLWNVTNGGESRTLSDHSGSVLAFSPDGQILASGSYEGIIKLWDLATGKEINTLPGHRGLRYVVFSPNGLILASVSHEQDEGVIKLWNLLTREEVGTLKDEHAGAANRMAFSPDGLTLVKCSSFPDRIRVWNLPTCEEVGTLTRHTSSVSCVAFSPDGQILASGSHDGTIKVWDKNN